MVAAPPRSSRQAGHPCVEEPAGGPRPAASSRVTPATRSAAGPVILYRNDPHFRIPGDRNDRRREARRIADSPRGDSDAGVHAGRDAGGGQGRASARPRRPGCRGHALEHLSPLSPSGRWPDCPTRRPAPVHRVGPADPDRQRRLPGVLARRAADDRRAGDLLQIAPGRLGAPAHTREGHGHPGEPGVGHRHGAGRVPGLSGHPGPGGGLHGANPALGGPVPAAVQGVTGTGLRPQASGLGPGRRYTHQPRPGAVRYRAGRDVPRYTCRQRPGHGRPRFRGLRRRRPKCRGTARIDVRDCRRHHPAPAGRPAPLPHGNRDAGGPGRIGGPRDRHVRLRDAHPERPKRPVVHQ